LNALRKGYDKELSDPMLKRAEAMTDEEIAALDKDRQPARIARRQHAAELRQKIDAIDAQVDGILNGQPQAATVPAGVAPAVAAQPVAAPAPKAKSKVARANELAKLHPNWSKERIIKMVNLELANE